MRKYHSISSAPRDGTTVTIIWTDFNGQENESPGRYRSLMQLQKAGGDWDENDSGWWVFTDSTTMKKVEPTAWIENPDEEENDDN